MLVLRHEIRTSSISGGTLPEKASSYVMKHLEKEAARIQLPENVQSSYPSNEWSSTDGTSTSYSFDVLQIGKQLGQFRLGMEVVWTFVTHCVSDVAVPSGQRQRDEKINAMSAWKTIKPRGRMQKRSKEWKAEKDGRKEQDLAEDTLRKATILEVKVEWTAP